MKLLIDLLILFVSSIGGSYACYRMLKALKKAKDEGDEARYDALEVVFWPLFVIVLGTVASSTLTTRHTIVSNIKDKALIQVQEEKIEILEEGIDFVQKELMVIVNEYADYEGETLKGVTPESMELLAFKYPELKGNQLAIKRIEILEENRKEINKAKMKIVEAKERLIVNQPFYKPNKQEKSK